MKYFNLILSFFFYCTSYSQTYYVSASGNNTTGLSPTNAWQTIAKLNSMFSIIGPGDSVLLHGGETFTGTIRVTTNGSSGAPIVIGSYGTGKATISGLTPLTGWTLSTGNVWVCTPSTQLPKFCNIFTINGTPQAVGRTNTWYQYESANTTTLTANDLINPPLNSQTYVGAQLCVRKSRFRAECNNITNQSGNILTYTRGRAIDKGQASTPDNGTPNYGFFLQRFRNSLDVQGEWFFDSVPNKMYLYSTSNPTSFTIKASYIDTLIVIGTHTNITVTNLNLEGAGLYGTYAKSSTNIYITNCTFNNNTRHVYFWDGLNLNVSGCTMNNGFNSAIQCDINSGSPAKQVSILNNTITNTGMLMGMGLFASSQNLKAMLIYADTSGNRGSFINIIGNTVRNVGYMGMEWKGSNTIIRRNIIDSFCLNIDDGGGIYTFVNNQSINGINYVNQIVDSNFVSNGIGAFLGGSGVPKAEGIYLDDQSLNVVLRHNTVWDVQHSGIQMNNPKNQAAHDNTVFRTEYSLQVNMKDYGALTGNRLTRNILYQTSNVAFNFFHFNKNLSFPTPKTIEQSIANMAYIDSNWITNLRNNGNQQPYYYYYSTNGSAITFPPNLSLAQWRSSTWGSHDFSSILPPATVNSTTTHIYTNPSNNLLPVNFIGFRKVDPKGVTYDHQTTVGRWSSLILIDNGLAPGGGNISPVANAGADISVTLPTSTATLVGSGTDADGTIVAYLWTKISGPTGGNISSSTSATTNITALQQGTYVFSLRVTDNLGATGSDVVQVIVSPANIAPTANAGADQTITLPTSAVTLTGSGNDPDGTIASYLWTKVSGPTGGNIMSSTTATTNVTSLQQGTYVFSLRVTDNMGLTGSDLVQVIVNAANVSPTANAGVDQAITLPTSTATLSGSGTDPDGTITAYLWEKISGPTGGNITSVTSASTTVTALQQGTYIYKLTVTDNSNATGTDFMQIVVSPANIAPTANAGTDQTITLPTNSTTLSGSGTDPDGTIASYAWVKIGGPAGGNITSPSSASTGITSLQQGTYVFRLTVTDNLGLTGTDFVQVKVDPFVPPVNQPPVAVAGNDQTITLPTSTTTLNGTGSSDPDGTITAYLWTKLSGPAGGTITSSTSATTGITALAQGVYIYQLRVMDNSGDTATDAIQVTVNPAPIAPTANAGPDQSITLPTSTATLTGSGTDPDGTIAAYLWTKISGPTGGAITSPTNATTGVTGLTAGTYIYQLRLTDNSGDTATDAMQMTVNAANIKPVANGGGNKTVTLPISTTTLFGSGTDADGTIVGYLWRKTSGPSGGNISSSTSATTNITGLIQGVYIFQLRVMDNSGDTATDAVQVTVYPANIAPTANAGSDQTIQLPTSTTTLVGSGTDPDGTIAAYLWTKINGPSGGAITSSTSATTGITGLIQGVYFYQLRVTDNVGDTATDVVQITVNPAPPLLPPVADAGIGQTVQLPANTATLTGSATDADGTITGYAWAQVSGPNSATGVPSVTATTNISNLIQGTYYFQLTATDNDGLTDKDTTQVDVVPIPPNTPPVANAGGDAIISNPSLTLNGAGSDVGTGYIVSYHWEKTSGPMGDVIQTPDSASTTISGLVIGTYTYDFTVTDNEGATDTDSITVTVVPPPAFQVLLRFYRLF